MYLVRGLNVDNNSYKPKSSIYKSVCSLVGNLCLMNGLVIEVQHVFDLSQRANKHILESFLKEPQFRCSVSDFTDIIMPHSHPP